MCGGREGGASQFPNVRGKCLTVCPLRRVASINKPTNWFFFFSIITIWMTFAKLHSDTLVLPIKHTRDNNKCQSVKTEDRVTGRAQRKIFGWGKKSRRKNEKMS